jgi:hypothetical protein
MEVSGQLHAQAALPPGKDPGTHWIGGGVGPRAGVDAGEWRNTNTKIKNRSLCPLPRYLHQTYKLKDLKLWT